MKILLTLSILLTLNIANAKKTVKQNPVLSPSVEIQGKYIKADKKYVYIKPNKSMNIIKIRRGFMLNSPSNLKKGMRVRYKIPLIALLESNKNLLSKK